MNASRPDEATSDKVTDTDGFGADNLPYGVDDAGHVVVAWRDHVVDLTRATGLDVGRDRPDYELALKRIDRNLRIGHGTVAIGQPVDVCAEKLATLNVGIDLGREQDFGIRVDNGPRIDRLARLSDLAARSRLQNVHMRISPAAGQALAPLSVSQAFSGEYSA